MGTDAQTPNTRHTEHAQTRQRYLLHNLSARAKLASKGAAYNKLQLVSLQQPHCPAPVSRACANRISGEVRVGSASLLLISYHPIVTVGSPVLSFS